MSEKKDPADPSVKASGDDDKTPETKSETVTREAHERLLGEKKDAKAKLTAAEAELAQFRKEKADREAEEAKARGDFETASKADKERIAALEKESQTLKAERLESRKYGAFIRNLGAQLDPKFAGLVDLDLIEADADGRISEASVTKYVSDFKKTYPETIATQGNANIPGVKPQGGGSGPNWDTATTLKEKKEALAAAAAAEIAKLGAT